MIQKIRAIVLHHIKYGDTSIIVHLYTDLYGRQSVIVKGARGQRKNRKISLYHPLALLDMELYYKENRDLQQIREAHPIVPLQGIMSDPIKNSVSLFLAEVLYRCIRENESNPPLFDYLLNSIQLYDIIDEGASLFHLHFLANLTRFLGFRPNLPNTEGDYWLNLETGSFSITRPIHNMRMDPELSRYLIQLMKTPGDQLGALTITRVKRNLLIEKLLDFYSLHLEGMGEIKSFKVLKAVFG
ncbi:MAG: DNA repair protein RecO [Bacteroidales bacterium]|nr:DNA repair protein RecO [Bacteroidales bacterium]